ncbi:hypothetical protein BH09ACT12_BH09ACT12_35780 [soil metagenome]
MSVVRRLVVAGAAAVVIGTLSLTGCTREEQKPPAEAEPSSTPLEDFATDEVSVARAEFCARVAPSAVADALGGDAADSGSWANGDRTGLADGVRDVAHEYGCSWTAADGTAARAWVFAPPVTTTEAAQLARQAGRVDGCRTRTSAPAYGAPSTAVSCRADGRGRTTYQGLFGDAWLTCSLEAPGAAPAPDRTGRWCVAVAQAASSS